MVKRKMVKRKGRKAKTPLKDYKVVMYVRPPVVRITAFIKATNARSAQRKAAASLNDEGELVSAIVEGMQ